ncbi:hypothetical protein FEM48_Zijuj10G0113200 [Ziziphus jujuba var. spinosa]|uniref:Uncharacterized protein n=3 Tax=Ziziphus jujuba TaxID=326968 RepID=A0A978UN28_ZIZJJ|nr:hypothetical protein FEM48_Zijuj10G0113200 [Ziziphus jujuba var. spinosa]
MCLIVTYVSNILTLPCLSRSNELLPSGTWVRLVAGCVKINCDGAYRPNASKCGLGRVVCNNLGYLHFKSSLPLCRVVYVPRTANKAADWFSCQALGRNLPVSGSYPLRIHSIFQDILHFKSSLPLCSVVYVPRTANKAADCLVYVPRTANKAADWFACQALGRNLPVSGMDSYPLRNTKLKMKTVSGSIISSRPISLSKATATLSMFVSTDTGASQAIGAYLRRTLASFKELKQLKKELKTARSDRKRKRHSSDIVDNGEMATVESPIQSVEGIEELKLNQGSAKERKKRKKHASDIVENGEMTTGQIPTQSVEATQELSQGSVPKRKKQKRHTSDIVNSGHMTTGENPIENVEATQELNQESVPKRKKHRKKN